MSSRVESSRFVLVPVTNTRDTNAYRLEIQYIAMNDIGFEEEPMYVLHSIAGS